MTVALQEVAELRAAGEALDLNDVDTTLRMTAEVIAFTIFSLRDLGLDEDEVLDGIELLLRAVDEPRENIREARNTLALLGYGRDLSMLLTKVARAAKPKPPPRWASRVHDGERPSSRAFRPDEAALSLALLRPSHKGGR